jgi:UDP:flavonoid glycosyltransferase YjiC (YdhE family)
MNTLLFAPAAYDLAETTRTLEIAKACREKFNCTFLSYGGQFEQLIEKAGFPIHRLEPRLTPEKIEHIFKVDKGEKLGVALTEAEVAARVKSELALYEQLHPAAVITGFSLVVPLSTRISHTPLVWIIQSTWLRGTGLGMIDPTWTAFRKKLLTWVVSVAATIGGNLAVLNPINRVARRYGVTPIADIFEFWYGDTTLLAEPAEFSDLAELPPNHHYIGPLIAREDYPIPPEIEAIPHDLPLVYFAMGSSGTPEIVARILQGFAGTPYRVIAPVKQLIEKMDIRLPENVIVTGWLPAHMVNPLADISVIHGGIGTVMTAALAGKPVVGVGMQPEQDANLDCLVRKGFAIRIPKRKADANKILAAVDRLYHDPEAKHKAQEFAAIVARWDGPRRAAELLEEKYGDHHV